MNRDGKRCMKHDSIGHYNIVMFTQDDFNNAGMDSLRFPLCMNTTD